MGRVRGFSLAEVAIVAAIVGVLASLGVASLLGVTSRARQQRDADSVEELVRRARNIARTERRCVRIDATATTLTLTPIRHGTDANPKTAPFDCAGGTDDTAHRVTTTMTAGVRLSPTSFHLDRAGGAVGGAQDIVVNVTVSGVPPRTFTVRTFVGAGAVVRRG